MTKKRKYDDLEDDLIRIWGIGAILNWLFHHPEVLQEELDALHKNTQTTLSALLGEEPKDD